MQAFKKILALTLACTLALSMGAVSVLAANEEEAVGASNIELSATTMELTVGGTDASKTLEVTGLGLSGVNASTITWTSSDNAVATVDTGKTEVAVTAKAAGETTITVTVPGVSGVRDTFTGTCAVTVKAADPEKPNNAALKLTIDAAEKLTRADEIAEDGSTVDSDKTWVTEAVSDAFDKALKEATEALTATEQTVIDAADEALVTAMDAYKPKNGTKKPTEEIKLDDLKATIKKATELKMADEIAEDGSTVATDKTWVTKAVSDAFTKALKEATAAQEATEQTVVDAADKALVAAMDAYKPANGTKKPTEELKFADLEAAIAAAKKVTKADVIAEKASSVAYDKTWVTKAISDAFDKALTDAEAALKATKQEDIDAATKALNAAAKAYVPAKGTKTEGGGNGGSSGNGGAIGGGSNNTANAPETVEKVKDAVAALKDPTLKLPADAAKTITAGGATVTTIPVSMTSGNANVGMDMIKTLGDAPASVGIKFTVKSGMTGGSMEIVVPGGFGAITEPGRISYSMDYADKAASNDDMLKAVKGEGVTSTTAKIGGNQTLPVTATITVATKVANGTTVNIYKYDPLTKKFIVVGKAVAKDGKLTFGTKIMGEMLFTTGTI